MQYNTGEGVGEGNSRDLEGTGPRRAGSLVPGVPVFFRAQASLELCSLCCTLQVAEGRQGLVGLDVAKHNQGAFSGY